MVRVFFSALFAVYSHIYKIVLFLHYSDVIRDKRSALLQLADFLGHRVASDAALRRAEQHTSLPWMRAHVPTHIFTMAQPERLLEGALYRKGIDGDKEQLW